MTIKVDERGFFLYWIDQKKVNIVLLSPIILYDVIARAVKYELGIYRHFFLTRLCLFINRLFFFRFFQDCEVIDMSTIRDTRTGRYARVPKVFLFMFYICVRVWTSVCELYTCIYM